VVIGLIAWVFSTCPNSAAQPSAIAGSTRTQLAFISDTQTPLWIESLVLGSDRNEEATDSLFADILRLRPAALFMLGDLVSLGAYPGAWEKIDLNIQAVRSARVPVHALLGNHELMYQARTGEKYFAETFPAHIPTGYCVSVDSVAVVLLNSNFDKLEDREQEIQQQWYARTLDSLERDSGTVCIVVCCHHSPFSNSTVVGSSEAVQQQFVPAFLRTSKCMLFLSGHAHAFEHFQQRGKDFIVIGGGGGSRHRLFTGDKQNWNDISPERKPLFHYITLDRHTTSITMNIHQLRDDHRGVDVGCFVVVNSVHPAMVK
jgi:hypothetical protein